MIALFLVLAQGSREVIHSDRPVEVRLPVSTEKEHHASVVTFPEESLEALVAGWNEGDLSVERRRENLFLKLLRKAEGDLHVMGASGTLYRLALKPSEGPYDGHVRILAPREKKKGAPEAIELIRLMRLGRRPPDGAVLRASEELYRSPVLAARLVYVYESGQHRGFVARVENLSSEPQRLDPSRFTGRGLVLVGAREMLLKPGERTLLYLVFGKAP